MSREFDLVVLGGGIGGYTAAIRAAQLGMSVALVEKEKLGGTCLHKGCIPTKAMLRSAEVYATIQESEKYGVRSRDVQLDFELVTKRKEEIIEQLHKGVTYLMNKGKIEIYKGLGRVMGPSIFSPQAGAVRIESADGDQEIIVPRFLLIATGSRPQILPGLAVDGTHIMTSDEALNMDNLPKSLLIVGGGVIGVEWASMMSDFGVEVTLIEYADRILPGEDEEISRELSRLLRKRKVKVVTKAKLLTERVAVQENQVTIEADINGKQESFTADRLLLAVGRVANVDNLGLEATEIQVNSGKIEVNGTYQTSEPHIYAVGDVIGGMQLAHVAAHEGILAVEHMNGLKKDQLDPLKVPRCTYSRPEVASIGLSEKQAKEQGFQMKIGKFSFKSLGKALVHGENDGFIKIIMDEKTEDVLGIHMIGPHVTELISQGALARVLDATPWEISQAIQPHPSLGEAFGEAALSIEGLAINA
ncbi:dihydrolipoyl dehydrogenase [Brevibacillus daliensis]|uniref:dihydrolipoyl dehydrogenase n=1 Tax=Brevibacillus daliensis TaxID=2892995 RepID=UPI001E44F5B7|nr:dihydrolipoyl dehydrogenase [Brevibacillus daliensis]